MVTPSSQERVRNVIDRIRRKTWSIRNGGRCPVNQNQVGILPSKGWHKRNVDFFGKTVFPSIFQPRSGGSTTPAFPEVVHGKAAVTWIGHATFLVQVAGKSILVDPNWAMWLSIFKRVRHPGVALGDLPPIDLVLVTHAHHDHLHVPSLRAVANRQPILVPEGVGNLVRNAGFGPVHEMRYWENLRFGDVEVSFTPALHWGARFVHDTHRQFGGFVVRAPGVTVYHAGDSAAFDGFAEIGCRYDVDVALLPIGAYRAPSGREVHMNPEEALDAFEQLNASWMVPMHYGTFPLGGEPLHEPVQWLRREAGSRGLAKNVVVLPEGMPRVF